ncbi:glycosyltransferase family 2 protein [Chryseosolibacter indicus]|uniref:Glycosyltransferase n=1 Tax=Chryseosolibacter indicus TaxID=2782351 RepID=A0ABS5VXS4_9BACT|nr:glycosyltransferase [Chryseosolibacter indicus]MBT1706131.1 glycosyltransferase [Chryseosolibacter indicus]
MDVVIKSFNRPYYLERCLKSIRQHIRGYASIIVLDDGTPEQYLDKIQTGFPDIRIYRSEYYSQKAEAIQLHLCGKKAYAQLNIPVRFWREHIERVSDFFLLLEEDAWVTQPIDLGVLSETMRKNNVNITKLFWASSKDIIRGEKTKLNREVELIAPQLPIQNQAFASVLLTNKYRLKSLLIKCNVITSRFFLPYYNLYTVSSAIFNKQYWLYLWKDAQELVNESEQLKKALLWMNLHKQRTFAKSPEERIKTSYITTSVNSFRSIHFDFIKFNHYLNQAWFQNKLDVMENFPNDFTERYLGSFIQSQNDSSCSITQWKRWVKAFKSQFTSMGLTTD